jgi:hypothetical protein
MLPLDKRLPDDRGEVFELRQVIVHGGYVCEDVDAVHLYWRNSWRGPVDSELEVDTRRSSRRTVHRSEDSLVVALCAVFHKICTALRPLLPIFWDYSAPQQASAGRAVSSTHVQHLSRLQQAGQSPPLMCSTKCI